MRSTVLLQVYLRFLSWQKKNSGKAKQNGLRSWQLWHQWARGFRINKKWCWCKKERLPTAEVLTNIGGENALVVDLYLDPIHQQAHILGSRQRCRPPVLVLVLPAVFVLRPAWHDGAGLVCAGVADGAVDEVDSVEEVDHVDGDPVVEVLAVGKLHCLPEVQTRIQGGLRLLVQLEALRPRLKLALGSECPVFIEDLFQGSVHDCMQWRRLCLLGGFLIAVRMRPTNWLCVHN